MTVLLKYLKSTVQFKNRLVPRGIITGASTPALLLAWTNQVSREAPLAQGACKKRRIRPFELAGREPGMQGKHPPAPWDPVGGSCQWCFRTQ